jgi:hypothetical protein
LDTILNSPQKIGPNRINPEGSTPIIQMLIKDRKPEIFAWQRIQSNDKKIKQVLNFFMLWGKMTIFLDKMLYRFLD